MTAKGVVVCVAVLSSCGSMQPTDPDVSPVAIAPDGITFIAGDRRTFTCVVEISGWILPPGNPVPLGVDFSMNLAGQTRPQLPSIFLNPAQLNALPVAAQIFLFAHECGHVNSGDPPSEVAANCWGTTRIDSQRIFNAAEWETVRQVLIQRYPVAVGPYPSGDRQWELMQPCRRP